ncbi:restriction endonuclease subunit S [Pantoea sp. Marseille-Q5743]|uniref:restriction endonuclease subunit S n=1 Tax=Pantoea sp. Marseille-Q5743 TaxID=2972776 RepID=UPI0021C8785A|nr:restriction endonuclease subunit S [Pantoea sp. Marseille-Q5743]
MSVNSNTPEIRFEVFSGEWEEKVLGELAEIVRGASPRPIEDPKWFDSQSSVGWLRIRDVTEQDGRIHYLEQRISKLGQEKTRVLHEKHLLLSIAASVGKPVVNYVETGVHDGFLIFKKPLFELEFMYQWLKYFEAKWQQFGQPGSQVNLNSDIVKSQVVAIPTNEEQTAIGNYFQKLDSLINQHQQKHDKLSNFKKAMLEKMFPKQGETIPEIRFKGFSEKWEEKGLGTDVAEIIGGGTPSTSISEFWDGDIDWYSPTEIGNNVYAGGSQKKITALGLKSSSAKILPAGNTILFTSRAGIGDMAILAKPGATNQGFQSFIVKEGFSPYFIYSAGKQIKEFALKHASGSTFLEISGKQLGRMKILMPSLEEQTAIGSFFQKLDNLINQHQQQIAKLNNIKQACLSKMFV